ncbi:hypothetical protein ID0308_15350 [Helicobacter pylori]
MIVYDIDKKQPKKKSRKTILEMKSKLFLSTIIALIFILAFSYLK